MKQEKIWRDFAALSPELQKQVIDFIAFLRTRTVPSPVLKKAKRSALRDEAFVGMWRGRKDMQDSTSWVRKTRESEWVNPRG